MIQQFVRYHVGNMHMRLMRLVNSENDTKANTKYAFNHYKYVGNMYMRLMRLVNIQNHEKGYMKYVFNDDDSHTIHNIISKTRNERFSFHTVNASTYTLAM